MNTEQAKYEQAIGQMERCYSGCAEMNSDNREFVDFVIAALHAQQERENPDYDEAINVWNKRVNRDSD